MDRRPSSAGGVLPRDHLPGGIEAVRLRGSIGDDVLDAALRSEAAWLLLDATAADDPDDALASRLVRALERSGRRWARTCLVCRRRLASAGVVSFTSVEDACQARLYAEAGFGAGWAPNPSCCTGGVD